VGSDVCGRCEHRDHAGDSPHLGPQEPAPSDPHRKVSTDEREELRLLRREVAELRRANEILKAASAFFAAELDRPQQRS
jgi:transposase-like protein